MLNHVNSASNAAVLDAMDVQEKDIVLEVGFGGGALMKNLIRHTPCARLIGVELSNDMIDRAERMLRKLRPGFPVELKHGAADSLPVEDGLCSKICSVNTVYFWPSLQAGLLELRRVSKTGATLVLGYSIGNGPNNESYRARGFRFYSAEELRSAAVDAGFRLKNHLMLQENDQSDFMVDTFIAGND